MKKYLILVLALINISAYAQEIETVNRVKAIITDVINSNIKASKDIGELMYKYGQKSIEAKQGWRTYSKTDSINASIVAILMDNYADIIATKTNLLKDVTFAQFVVFKTNIQSRKKFISSFRTALSLKNANAKDYARFIDNICHEERKFQIYGTKLWIDNKDQYHFYPILKEPEINSRRLEIGLEIIEIDAKEKQIDYVKPEKDLYENSFALIGNIFSINKDKGITTIEIRSGEGILLANIVKNGFYKVPVKRNILFDFVTFHANSRSMVNQFSGIIKGQEVFTANY